MAAVRCAAVSLPAAETDHRRTRRPSSPVATRQRRTGDHGIPAALSPLVTPSREAVWTPVAGAGPLPWPLRTTCAHTRWLRSRGHPHAHDVTPLPDVRGPSGGHGRYPRPPRRCGAIQGFRLSSPARGPFPGGCQRVDAARRAPSPHGHWAVRARRATARVV